MHNCVAHTIQEFAETRVSRRDVSGGHWPDGRPVRADIALTGLATGAGEGDCELGDVTVRNFVGGKLNIRHNSDVDPRGVINAGYGQGQEVQKTHRGPRLADAWRSSSTWAVA